MIDRRDLHPFFEEADAVRLQRHRQEVEVRRIAQQILMDAEIFRHGAVGADPHLALWLGGVALHRVVELDGADLKRLIAEKLLFNLRRQQMRQCASDIRFRFKIVRRGGRGHDLLMLVARLRCLERGGHVKDRLTVLDGRDAARAEAVAVSQNFNVIHDGFRAIARA